MSYDVKFCLANIDYFSLQHFTNMLLYVCGINNYELGYNISYKINYWEMFKMTKNQKAELEIIKEIVEMECGEKVKVTYAEKPGWLLLKTIQRLKTVGCIRLNKNSFITLYLDTRDGIQLEKELPETIQKFKKVDIKSRQTGNFTQNKFKFMTDTDIDLLTEAINFVFNKDIVMVNKRIRHMASDSLAI